jgi:hypothetical protein
MFFSFGPRFAWTIEIDRMGIERDYTLPFLNPQMLAVQT